VGVPLRFASYNLADMAYTSIDVPQVLAGAQANHKPTYLPSIVSVVASCRLHGICYLGHGSLTFVDGRHGGCQTEATPGGVEHLGPGLGDSVDGWDRGKRIWEGGWSLWGGGPSRDQDRGWGGEQGREKV
jgi:hypothetical protein